MDIAVNPTLFIALGGTGASILNRVRRRLVQRIGTDRLPLIDYVYVDTDQLNSDAKNASEGVDIGITPQMGQELSDLRSTLAQEMELSACLSERALGQLRTGTTSGAKGFRQLGHVSFMASSKLEALQSLIRTRLNRLHTQRMLALGTHVEGLRPEYLNVRIQGVADQITIYAFASAGGGTGSSTFADIGYFLRRCLRGQAYEYACVSLGIACIASSTVGEAEKVRANSAGMLSELNHFVLGKSYRAAYPVSFPGDPMVPERNRLAMRRPYDYTFVVQPAQPHVGELHASDAGKAMNRLAQRVAEFAMRELVLPARTGAMEHEGGQQPAWLTLLLGGNEGRLLARLADKDNYTDGAMYRSSYPAKLLTLGVATRECPVALHHVLAYGLAVQSLAKNWSAVPKPPPDAAADQLGHPAADALLGSWLRRLCVHAEESAYEEERPHASRSDGLADALLMANSGDPVRAALWAEATAPQLRPGQPFDPRAWVAERTGRVSSLLMEVRDTPSAGEPGSLYARVRNQKVALSAWGQEAGWPNQLATELLDIAFNPDGGAGAALAVAGRLAERVSDELAFVELCREGSAQRPAVGVVRDSVVMRRDWLLKLATGVQQRAPEVSGIAREVWNEANSRLVSVVLEAKEAVLKEILDVLAKMQVRLRHLCTYFGHWRDRAPDMSKPEYQLSDEEREYVLLEEGRLHEYAKLRGTVIDLKKVRLYNLLGEEIAKGLPDADLYDRPALLAEGVPIDRATNKTDFSYLLDVERGIFEAIGQRPGGPYDLDVVQIMAAHAERDGRPLPDLQAEAEPLLQFNADDAHYRRDCPFPGSVDYWELAGDHHALGWEPFEQRMRATAEGYAFPDAMPVTIKDIDTHIPSILTIGRVRAGVVTTLIGGYRADAVRRITTNAIIPPFTDMRIKPPLDPDLLHRASYLFLGALVLGRNVIMDVDEQTARFVFRYKNLDVRKQVANPIQEVMLASDFETGRSDLAANDFDLGQLDMAVLGYLNRPLEPGVTGHGNRQTAEQRLTDVFKLLDHHMTQRHPDKDAKRLDVWGSIGEPGSVFLDGLDYEVAFSLLGEFVANKALRCEMAVTHNHAVALQVGDPVPNLRGSAQAAPAAGFYCRYCATFLGGSLPSDRYPCRVCHNTGTAVADTGQ